MASAVFRGARLAAIACTALGAVWGAEGAPRAIPSRPGTSVAAAAPGPASATARPQPRPTVKVGSTDYVSIIEAAGWLGMRGHWTEPMKKLTLVSASGVRLELESDSRNAAVDDLRIDLGAPTILRNGRLYISQIDLERCLAALIQPAVVPSARPPRATLIALDAGHGGADNGMENPRLGLKEKVLALDVVMRLKRVLEAGGYRVMLTRTSDGALAPEKRKDLLLRSELANRAGADLFVSVHFNSLYPDTRTGGTEVYVYTPARQRSSEAWSIGKADDAKPPQPVNRFDAWSSLLAHKLHRRLLEQLKTNDRGQKTKHLLVFQDLNCPAALIESVFLSQESEARRAATPEFRQRIAEAMAAGIGDYATAVAALHPKTEGASATRTRHHPSPSS